MSEPVGNESKLAFLARLLDRRGREEPLEALLTRLAEELSCTRVGVLWPCTGAIEIGVAVDRFGEPAQTPEDYGRMCSNLTQSGGIVAGDPEMAERRWTLFDVVPGQPGLLWADASADGGWNEIDEYILALVGGLLAKTRAFAVVVEREAEQARIRQRLDDAGTVCGRLAHDLDNLWTGILGFTDLTLPQLKNGSTAHNYVSEIGAIGQRGVQVTQQLHQFSRSGACKPIPSSVRATVERERLRLSARPDFAGTWDIKLQEPLPAVVVEANTLQALLAQLFENAFEARPSGTVAVVAATRKGNPEYLRSFRGDPRGERFVELTVSDQGGGIKEEILRRLLIEPFVTTKVRHRGLGLVIALRIIRAHGGGIRLESELGMGTTARVLLPIAATET